MSKFVGAAVVAGATLAGIAGANAGEISGNIALTSDYVFRGLSTGGEDPAIQGGFDWTQDQFYVGAWGSSLGSAGSSMELDIYAGFTPTYGPVEFDFGVIGYFYPGADDDLAEADYYEAMGAATMNVSEQFAVGGGVYYSPEYYGETGEALYYEINAAFSVNEQLEFSAADRPAIDRRCRRPGRPAPRMTTTRPGTSAARTPCTASSSTFAIMKPTSTRPTKSRSPASPAKIWPTALRDHVQPRTLIAAQIKERAAASLRRPFSLSAQRNPAR